MNCRSAENLLSSFLEDELSQRERRALESHLTECRRCSTAVEEMRATVDLLSALPAFETSPSFEEEVMDRIRSGEALRPTVIEWLSEWFSPVRLRPVFLAGAAGCAVWIALIVGHPFQAKKADLAQHAAPVAGSPALAQGSAAVPTAPGAQAPSPAPVNDVIASATRSASPSVGSNRSATLDASSSSAGVPDSARANPAAPYQDEYILDQFYLNRSEDGVHSIVPVTGRASDDVYIVF